MLLQRNFLSYGLLSLAVVLLLLPMSVFAQGDDPPSTLYIANDYIGVTFYADGDDTSGLFQVWNVQGDTSIPTDDNQPILDSGRAFILIDGVIGDGDDAGPGWLTFPGIGTYAIWGDLADDGMWVVPPFVVPGEKCIRAVYQAIPEDGPSTFVLIEMEIRLMHDQVRFKWTLTNNDVISHQIGIKMIGDIICEPENTGVLDLDNVVSAAGFPLIEEKSLFSAIQKIVSPYVLPTTTACLLPSFMEIFNAQADPGQGVRVTFDGQNATKPDMVGIDEYSSLLSTQWGFIPDYTNLYSVLPKAAWGYDPGLIPQVISSNLGYGAAWKPATVRPGQKRTIVHYVGNAGSNSVMNLPNVDYPKYTASVEGPRTLKYYIDSTTGQEQFDPATFRITAFLENLDRYTDLRNASFTLILPTGMALDTTETQYTKTITEIDPGEDGSVSWLVKANGDRTGILSYFVAVNANPMGGTLVKRDIHVPAISRQTLYYGYQQLSVPFELGNTEPVAALGLDLGSIAQTPAGDNYIFRYNPNLPAGSEYGDYEVVTSLVPGEAVWIALTRGCPTDMPAGNFAPKQWDGQSGYTIPVTQGWNMVGNPFVYAVTMGELRFWTNQYGSLTYDQAVAQKMISRTLYWWNTSFNTWNWSTARTAQVKPWQGYWIKILDPRVQAVVITPASQIGAGVAGAAPPSGDDDEDPPGGP